MTAFSFVGIAVTAATVVVYGHAVWNPVALLTRLLGGLPVLLVIAMVVIVISQVSTNMAANVVSPSNDFSNLAPQVISFRMGGVITALIGVVSSRGCSTAMRAPTSSPGWTATAACSGRSRR